MYICENVIRCQEVNTVNLTIPIVVNLRNLYLITIFMWGFVIVRNQYFFVVSKLLSTPAIRSLFKFTCSPELHTCYYTIIDCCHGNEIQILFMIHANGLTPQCSWKLCIWMVFTKFYPLRTKFSKLILAAIPAKSCSILVSPLLTSRKLICLSQQDYGKWYANDHEYVWTAHDIILYNC